LLRTGYIHDLAQLDDKNPWKWISFGIFVIFLIIYAIALIRDFWVSFLSRDDDRFWKNKPIKPSK